MDGKGVSGWPTHSVRGLTDVAPPVVLGQVFEGHDGAIEGHRDVVTVRWILEK